MNGAPYDRIAGKRNTIRRRSLGRGMLAGLAVGLPDRLRHEVGGLGGELGGALVAELLAPQLTGDPSQALADLPQPHVHAAAPRSRTIAPRMPLTNRGASAPQYSFASSTASSIATSAGVSVNSIS